MYIKDDIVTLYWCNRNVLNGANRVDFRTWDFMLNNHKQIIKSVRNTLKVKTAQMAHGWL